MSLTAAVRGIQDVMRADPGVDGDAQRLGQLVWLLFLKIWDERERELEALRPGFVSSLVNVRWRARGALRRAEDLRWRAWAADPRGLTGDALLEFVDATLFPALAGLEVESPAELTKRDPAAAEELRARRSLVRGVFEGARQHMRSGALLRQVLDGVQSAVSFADGEGRDSFGELYESLLRDLQSAGNAGEFYTPRAVTQFVVDMVAPRPGEIVLDPACGTGGFLTAAIERVRSTAEPFDAAAQARVRGVEKKPLPHMLCVTNMIAHGVDVPASIVRGNALARPLSAYGPRDLVDVVLSNPPFGGLEEPGVELGFPEGLRTRETADLFVALIVHLLKPGGRAAVVLPDGVLFGGRVRARIKELLLSECDLHTVVRLPRGAFAPYTTIRTNVLFFEKGRPTREVWYYEHPLPDGYKTYSKARPVRLGEFDAVKAWWGRRVESERSWRVSVESLRARGFDLLCENPYVSHAVREDARALFARYERERAEGSLVCERLREALEAALREGDGASNAPPALSHFDALVDAPEGIDRVRSLVVRLALAGRIVGPQSTEGTGAELLKRLTGRDDAPAAVLGETPARWASAALPEVATYAIGRTPPTKDPAFWAADGEGTPWVSIGDMRDGGLVERTARSVTAAAAEVFRRPPSPAGTLLMSFKLTLGKTATLAREAFHNEAIIAVSPKEGVLRDYLALALPTAARGGETRAAIMGATLNSDSLARLRVPLPPTGEQARIVAGVHALLELLTELEGSLARRDALHAEWADAVARELGA